MTQLQIAKDILKNIAYDAKSLHRGDKPMIRMIINNEADSIARNTQLTEKQMDNFYSYVCTLHPKD